MYKNLIFVFLAFLLASCGVKQEPIEVSYPVMVIVKSPSLKLSGFGFYKKGGNYVNLQLFSAGVVALNYRSGENICVNDECATRGMFNKKFFLHPHYDKLIDDILASRPIYGSKNLIKQDFGFSQIIQKSGEYDISYRANYQEAVFEDGLNGVLIKISAMEKQL